MESLTWQARECTRSILGDTSLGVRVTSCPEAEASESFAPTGHMHRKALRTYTGKGACWAVGISSLDISERQLKLTVGVTLGGQLEQWGSLQVVQSQSCGGRTLWKASGRACCPGPGPGFLGRRTLEGMFVGLGFIHFHSLRVPSSVWSWVWS